MGAGGGQVREGAMRGSGGQGQAETCRQVTLTASLLQVNVGWSRSSAAPLQ